MCENFRVTNIFAFADASQCAGSIQVREALSSRARYSSCIDLLESGLDGSAQDLSTNGLILNGHKVRRTSVILMDGDIIEIPSSRAFKCIHIWKQPQEKKSMFDPTPPTQPSHKKIGGYVVTSHCLGTGGFAAVHLAIDTAASRQVACKTIVLKKDTEKVTVMKEVKILLALDHPNISKILDVDEDGRFLWALMYRFRTFDTDLMIHSHIFLQLCTGGDLFTYISSHSQKGGPLCEGEAKYIMFQIFKGLKYLHDKMISHRDLKPENVLLYAPGPYPRIQIADFGLARPKAYEKTFTACGTVMYLPPEGILALHDKRLGYVALPLDCWSAGVIMYMMLAEQAIKDRIVHGDVEFRADIWDKMPDARGLVSRLLIHSHEQRATIASALHNQWIGTDLDDLEEAYNDRVLSG
ncbi:hypothetical protein EWM64_g611 [Hericium alpestre]|uniref:Protein kinase domain-containing protein n=1 Tax=Hericium alpestre TaxID=135208 RepID=A0A4Z0AAN9_9AGAM|nr:hypothetical protein EWM64_g611 [Hericium alpestre]